MVIIFKILFCSPEIGDTAIRSTTEESSTARSDRGTFLHESFKAGHASAVAVLLKRRWRGCGGTAQRFCNSHSMDRRDISTTNKGNDGTSSRRRDTAEGGTSGHAAGGKSLAAVGGLERSIVCRLHCM